jgi:hypothetical protein
MKYHFEFVVPNGESEVELQMPTHLCILKVIHIMVDVKYG